MLSKRSTEQYKEIEKSDPWDLENLLPDESVRSRVMILIEWPGKRWKPQKDFKTNLFGNL